MTAERAQEASAAERRAAARSAAALASPDGIARGLRLTPQECPVCGDEAAEPQAIAEDFHNPPSLDSLLALRCNACGCVYLSPGLTPTDRNQLLAEHGAPTLARRRPRRPAAVSRLAGAGLSPDGERVADVLTLGDDAVENALQEGRQYDCVILNENLEYLSDPRTQLADVAKALRPGGRVLLVLHNVHSPSFRLFGGRHWGGYDFPRQRAVYPRTALERLAGAHGLVIDRVTTAPDAGCWVESIRRVLEDWSAPRWLANRFQPSSVVAGAAFSLLDRLFGWGGRAALLIVSLRPAGSSAESSR